MKVFGDSGLVVNQVRGQNVIENNVLIPYKNKFWDFFEGFKAFNIKNIPQKKNTCVDRLVVLGAQYDILEHVANSKEQYVRILVRLVILDNCANWQVFDSDVQIINFSQIEEELFDRN